MSALDPRPVRRRGFTRAERIEIGERDSWLCGICQDPALLVERPPALSDGKTLHTELVAGDVPFEEEIVAEKGGASRRCPHPLSAVIDHVTSLDRGGLNTPDNLQIAHYRCNALKHNGPSPTPEYARAVLRHKLNGTPIPARVWQNERSYRPGSPIWRARYEWLARNCERGTVAIEPWRLALRYRVWRARRRAARRKRALLEHVH